MGSQLDGGRLYRAIEWLLAFVGAINCIVVPFLFAASQRELFPLPGLYFIEIVLLGVLVMVAVAAQQGTGGRWSVAPWFSAGALAAFVIVGIFSIGFFLIPATVAFLLTGILMDRRVSGNMARHAGMATLSFVVQGALMLLLTLVS